MSDATQIASSLDRSSEFWGGFFGDLMQLIKARLTLLVVITSTVGYCMASAEGGEFHWLRFVHAVVGTALVAASAAVFNQLAEVDVDRLMERTKNRPLPTGRVSKTAAFWIGTVLGVVGLFELGLVTTTVATLLAAVTLFIYVAIYTPMKRYSAWCVPVGAVSGAIPPVIGWTAMDGSMGLGAWVLFGILFAWQMPHFLAIAWMYREEYAAAGCVMLPENDTKGTWTAIQSFFYSVLVTAISLIPFFTGSAGVLYLCGAIFFNALMLVTSMRFLVKRTRASARSLFFASIIYLPGLLGLMVFTK